MISIYHGYKEESQRDWYALKVNGVMVCFDLAKIVQAVGIEVLATVPRFGETAVKAKEN